MCFSVTEDLLKEGDVPVADLLEREVYSYVRASFEASFPSHLSLCQKDSLNTQLRVQSISMATTSGYNSNSIHVRDLLGRSSLTGRSAPCTMSSGREGAAQVGSYSLC